MRNSFVLYHEYKIHIDLLKEKDKAQLLDAIFNYSINGELSELSELSRMAFSFIKADMDRNIQKYNKIVERNTVNGKKPKEAKKATGLSGMPNEAKKAVYVDVDVSVDDDVSVNDNVVKIASELNLSQQENEKLEKEYGSTEYGTKILDQMKKLFDYKLKKKELDPDQSHYDQLTGWIFEYVKNKPGNVFLWGKHQEAKAKTLIKTNSDPPEKEKRYVPNKEELQRMKQEAFAELKKRKYNSGGL